MSEFAYRLLGRDGRARLGQVQTAHGVIHTPAFMPVGTVGTVKAMTPESVASTGAEIVLGNTYHLMLRPGAERVERLGGLHRFMHWPGPILTDSGGFQVMSLSKLRTLTEDGVRFQSHLDGSSHMLSPERSMDIQRRLDADISMCFDECTPFPATQDEAARSMRLSLRWAGRSKDAFVRAARLWIVRHCPGQRLCRAAGRIGGRTDRHRLRRLCRRRIGGGRGAG